MKNIKTWHYEIAFVAIVLCLINFIFQNNAIAWVTTLAILLTFNHAQIGDRLAEREKQKISPDVKCYWKMSWLFICKEIVWILVFIMTKNYAAISGAALFALYPSWRKIYRRKYPVVQNIRP